jgi:hypothetical protein
MVKIELLKKESIEDFTSKYMNEAKNISYELVRDKLQEEFRDAKCKIHKSESFGTIYINGENSKMELGSFCCDEFKNGFDKLINS